MDGDHPNEASAAATLAALRATFAELVAQRVVLEHLLLKPNMVLAGRDGAVQPSVQESATATLRCLRAVVPPAVPGVVFLSGGQDPELATARLNAMNAAGPQPWVLTFSYSRAIQDPVLAAWRGDPANVAAAQAVFADRARRNGLARMGRYELEETL
jgi:fructose-bisphosphate aldolase class I